MIVHDDFAPADRRSRGDAHIGAQGQPDVRTSPEILERGKDLGIVRQHRRIRRLVELVVFDLNRAREPERVWRSGGGVGRESRGRPHRARRELSLTPVEEAERLVTHRR